MTETTTLKSDVHELETVLEVRPSGWQRVAHPKIGQWARLPTSPTVEAEFTPTKDSPEEKEDEKPKVKTEKWFFVNGVATELYWLRLACKKLAKWSSREITGVYNRGDGILWDLIECAGERDATGIGHAASQRELIERTESSMRAQKLLKKQLETALLAPTKDGKGFAHIVMIAHSQGCLVLRLALEELVAEDCPGIRKSMLQRLCVFTFGNPSVDWKLDEPDSISPFNQDQGEKGVRHLSSHVLHTEHFANKLDFVAKLGVISEHKQESSGYEQNCVFVNKESDWIGHLFGTQYSLDKQHYKDEKAVDSDPMTGDKSWLLNCGGGGLIADARTKARV
ncbi:hypothetical protein H2201_008236 [Coniosporium apollinis]|uniref:DUF676 domain-containing protein n=1 Tax=Coniosporium apollinis TaxID=61459 RepID=A0ABQ9NGM4_9PEZI|nr:hypothetical protein H2201_008236 [Coniosporium apollinis]